MLKKISILFLLFFITLVAVTTPVHAEEKKDENLKIVYKVDKTLDKDIKISLSIKNISNDMIKNINVKNMIPSDFSIKDNSEFIIEKLDKNETAECILDVVLKKDINNHQINNKTNTQNTSDINKNNQIDNVGTGDQSHITAIISGLIISIVLAFIIIKLKKKQKFCSLILVLAMAIANVKFIEANDLIHKEIQLKEHIVINNKDYEFRLKISYDIKSKKEIEDLDTITRGEWIDLLVASMDYEEMNFELNKPYFADAEGSFVEDSINYAVANGIVNLEDEKFYPNELASREFVAVTTVKALGYLPQEDLQCIDSNEIKDLKNSFLAVKLGIIDLVDNYFYPMHNATGYLVNRALDKVKETNASTIINEENYSNIKFNQNVEVFTKEESNVNDNKITLNYNEQAKKLKINDIIAIKDVGCYKVEDIQYTSDKVVLLTSVPEMNEAIKSINFAGKVHTDLSQFIPADNVEIQKIDEMNNTYANIGALPFEITIPGAEDITIKGSLGADINVETKCDVEFQYGIPPINCKNLMLRIDPKFTLDVGVYVGDSKGVMDQKTIDKVNRAFKNGYRCKGSIHLGKLPIAAIPGARIFVQVGISYDANGYFEVVWNFDGDFGIQILNNHPRLIHSGTTSLNPVLGGDVKVGPELAAILKTLNYNIIDLSASVGGAGSGSVTSRPNSMICNDLGVNVYCSLSALNNSKLHDWFKWGYELDIWNNENSPIAYNAHFEDFHHVDRCTYTDAAINGLVLDADSNHAVNDATVTAINLDAGEIEVTTKTNSSGSFSLKLKSNTNYCIKTTKTGYISCEEDIKLNSNEIRQLQTRMQVKGTDDTTDIGIAGGKIIDAHTGKPISNVLINVRKNWSNKTGDIIKTYRSNSSGVYIIDDLSLGNYTLELIKDNYVKNYLNIYVTSSGNMNQHAFLNPMITNNSDLRVVLTWGEEPYDVDLHMKGLSPSGDLMHISYYHKRHKELDKIIADLDVDDTHSYGPETVTVYDINPNGTYSFYVRDFSNRMLTDSTMLSNSQASLTIYVKGEYVRTIHIPPNNGGTVWHAFDYDAKNSKINLINKFSYE